jgi:hypothetical protein
VRPGLRRLAPALVAALALAVAGCGGDEREAAAPPPGSPENPLVSAAVHDGTDPDAPGGAGRPNYRDLVARQSAEPEVRSSPCALVTKKQAEDIVGGKLADPFEAPQGPTCIYRDAAGDTFVAIALQQEGFDAIRDEVRRLRTVDVGGRKAYCGVHGAPILYLPLDRGRALSVSAQCDVAVRFASHALPRLAR